jgi:hypothetical protein
MRALLNFSRPSPISPIACPSEDLRRHSGCIGDSLIGDGQQRRQGPVGKARGGGGRSRDPAGNSGWWVSRGLLAVGSRIGARGWIWGWRARRSHPARGPRGPKKNQIGRTRMDSSGQMGAPFSEGKTAVCLWSRMGADRSPAASIPAASTLQGLQVTSQTPLRARKSCALAVCRSSQRTRCGSCPGTTRASRPMSPPSVARPVFRRACRRPGTGSAPAGQRSPRCRAWRT